MTTRLETARYNAMSNDEKHLVYFKVQRLATECDYGYWWRGKSRSAAQHKISVPHVNAIIRLVSGKSSSVPKLHRANQLECGKCRYHCLAGYSYGQSNQWCTACRYHCPSRYHSTFTKIHQVLR